MNRPVTVRAWVLCILFASGLLGVGIAGCIASGSATGSTAALGAMAPVTTPSTILPPANARIPESLTWSFRLLGEVRLPYRMRFQGTIVGGLSGIDYDAERNLFYLISDDRSEYSPARFYSAALEISESGFSEVTLRSVVTLLGADARPLPRRPSPQTVDPEAIRFDPRTQTLLWVSEGERAISMLSDRFVAPRLIDPAVREAGLDGRFIGELPLPPMFRMHAREHGPRGNLVFEGLALAPDGKSLWTAMEGPLFQDGPVAHRRAGALVRLSRLARNANDGPALLAQYAYRTEPLPHSPILPGGMAENGVSEILALSEQRLLVLERAYVLGRGMTIRLFEADFEDASDVREIAALYDTDTQKPANDPANGLPIRPASKRLVLDFATLGVKLDNIEGMSWGPTLANGNRTLVFVSDDNFNPLQTTQFIALVLIRP